MEARHPTKVQATGSNPLRGLCGRRSKLRRTGCDPVNVGANSADHPNPDEMAERIGVVRKWFQRDHYDITKSKRAQAVMCGAKEITWRQAGAMMFLKRKGYRMGSPATVEDRVKMFKG